MNYFADVDTIAPSDCIIHSAPMSHGSGIYGIPHVARGANQVTPESGHFDPAETVDLINRLPGATFFFAPTMVVRLLQSPALDRLALANLKTIVYGGGPMYVADLLKGLERLGPKFVQIYGQGEAPMTITALSREQHLEKQHPRYLERLGSAGVARTDVEVRVFDPEDRELPPGEIGEIVVRGLTVMCGYWNRPALNTERARGGWHHTNDLGRFEIDGTFSFVAPKGRMLKSAAENIYPVEVERCVAEHPSVAECAVIGVPDDTWVQAVKAIVVLREGARLTADEVIAHCRERIASYKKPKFVEFTDAIPRKGYAIDYEALDARYGGGAYPGGTTRST
jgi:acyl-CoA synthetase (AMP-forming)/AMP-acid ligase II